LAPVHWIIEIDILLKPAEIGKDGLPVPAARTGLLPAFEVAWQPAQRKLRVDARSPAHHPRLMEEGRRPVRFRYVLALSAAGLQLGPKIIHVRHGPPGIDRENVGRRRFGQRVGSGFQQNHAIVRISGKTVGQYAAGRAAANDQMGRNQIRLS
jgi:hypothetical protein